MEGRLSLGTGWEEVRVRVNLQGRLYKIGVNLKRMEVRLSLGTGWGEVRVRVNLQGRLYSQWRELVRDGGEVKFRYRVGRG